MAIKKVKTPDTQTELVTESREERLTRLLDIETVLQGKNDKLEALKAQANEVRNEIKSISIEKSELVHKLNSGQEVFVPVPTEPDETPDNDDDVEIEGAE